MTKLRLNVFDPHPRIVRDLQRAFDGLESVTVQLVERMRYLEPPGGLDVLYLPLAAAEQFGSKPFIHESQVLPTRNGQLPPFVVTGTCLAPDDPRGPVPEMRILLSAVFNAIRSFNLREDRKLERIGFWAYDLLPDLTAVELREIMLDVVPELRADVHKP